MLFRIIFGTLSFPITIAVTIKKTSFHTAGSKRPHRWCPLRIANWGQNIDHEHTFVPYLWPTMAFVLGRGAFSHGGAFRADTVVRHCGSSVRGRAGVLSSGNAERLTPARSPCSGRSTTEKLQLVGSLWWRDSWESRGDEKWGARRTGLCDLTPSTKTLKTSHVWEFWKLKSDPNF